MKKLEIEFDSEEELPFPEYPELTFGVIEVSEDEDFSRFAGVGPWFPDECS